MVTFRCKQTGNSVTFHYQHDIDSMIGHDGYERVEDTVEIVELPVLEEVSKPAVKKGRPRKTVT